MRKDLYSTLLGAVDFYASIAREYWKKHLKKEVPFISVAHDIWDSTKKEVLGVSIYFYCPTRAERFKVPIGLAVASSKSSDEVANQTMRMLAAVGVQEADIYKAVNGTTNSAVAVGRLLSGENGTCAMHQANLIIGHATGRLVRKVSRRVVDSFPEAESLRKASEAAAGYLMNKKAKNRFLAYQQLMADKGRSAIRLAIPNSTRAGGVALHYESMIKSRWNLYQYWHSHPQATAIEDGQFWTMSQLCSVLYPLLILTKNVQSDRFGAISYSTFFFVRAYVLYLYQQNWWVAGTRRQHNPDEESRWDATAAFPPRKHSGAPITAKKGDAELGGSASTIKMIKVKKSGLDGTAKKLIQRIVDEFPKYAVEPTNGRLLAMACNPFAATCLLNDLECQAEIIKESAPEGQKNILDGLRGRAKALLVAEIKKHCEHIIPNNAAAVAAGRANEDDNEDDEDRLQQLRAKRQRQMLADSSNDNVDPVEAEVDAFFRQSIDIRSVISSQEKVKSTEYLTESLGLLPNDWVERADTVVKVFDVMEWWGATGQFTFKLIYPVACMILALPDSNGDQERTFSAATWMDGKLNSLQKDTTFQMKVLTYKNSAFLKQHAREVQDEWKERAAKRTKKLLKERVVSKESQEDVDSDMEGLLEAYSIDEESEE